MVERGKCNADCADGEWVYVDFSLVELYFTTKWVYADFLS